MEIHHLKTDYASGDDLAGEALAAHILRRPESAWKLGLVAQVCDTSVFLPKMWQIGQIRRSLETCRPASLMHTVQTGETVSNMEGKNCHQKLSLPLHMNYGTCNKHANTHIYPLSRTQCVTYKYKPIFYLELKFELHSSSLVYTILATNLPDRTIKSLSN